MINRIIINSLIEKSGIRPGDTLWTKNQLLGLQDHYVVYLGKDDFEVHWVVGRFEHGIRVLTEDQIAYLIKHSVNVRMNRFSGSDELRMKAVDRMYERLDTPTFMLILRHCQEHVTEVKAGNDGFQWDKVKKHVGIGLTVLGAVGIASAAWKWWIEPNQKNKK
jgi:hypothetical protein